MNTKENETNFQEHLLAEITEIKRQLVQRTVSIPILPEWLPRKDVMRFFSYGDTQMAALEKNTEIVVAKVGRRKFISRTSLIKLIERNILSEGS